MDFAKIIECDGEQVLFYIEPDTDNEKDDREMLHQIVRLDGLCVDVKLSGMTFDQADKAFASLDDTAAKRVVDTVRSMLNDLET